MAEKMRRMNISAGRKTPQSKNEQVHSPVDSRPGSSTEPVNPGEIVEVSVDPAAQQYNTLVDNRPPQAKPANVEFMAEQSEIIFPVSEERSSSVQSRHQYPGARDVSSLGDDVMQEDEESELVIEPPQSDPSLPDLCELMASLDENSQTDLKPTRADAPPSLFSRPEHIASYKTLTDLKLQIEEEDIEDYIREFEAGVKDDVLMIGTIHLEDVQLEEQRLRAEAVDYLESEAAREEALRRRIHIYEEQAKKRAAYVVWQKRKEIQRMEQLQQQRERLMLDRLQRAFRRSENQLISDLERRKGEIKTYYGDLMTADGHYGGSRGRRWKVDWDRTPQPIQIKLKCFRGVKDKIPGGQYVLMVSMYNRLGGQVMRWSNIKGQQWGGATLPVNHDGHFYNTEIKLGQSVFTVLPAKPGIRPGMIMVFELFLLRGAVVASDRVVAWGIFPIADGQFDVLEGKFKCAMLRGEVDDRIEKHEKLEALMSSDLDHWMCNLYFEVVKLPRYMAGQKEYEVELQFSSGILAYPDRLHGDEDMHDGENVIHGSMSEVNSMTQNLTRMVSDSEGRSEGSQGSSNAGSYKGKPGLDDSADSVRKPDLYPTKADSLVDLKKPDTQQPGKVAGVRHRRPYSTIGSRRLQPGVKVKVCDESDDEDMNPILADSDYLPVKGKPGLFYKKHEHSALEHYHKKLFSLLPETSIMTELSRKRQRLTHLEQLAKHKYSVRKLLNEKGRLPHQAYKKVQYVRRQLLAELGLSQWRSREFWGMLFMFILVFFIRIYVHYVSQWALLQSLQLPINKFNFLPYTVEVNYQATLLRTREEIAMVLVGPLGNIALFILLVLTSLIFQKVAGSFPEIGSKLVLSYGIQAFLDPLLILIVDCALKRYENQTGTDPIGDCAKLYWHFYRAEGSGLAGIFITIFLYAFTGFFAAVILYMYFLRLHNNGRMLDIYWRLHGDEDMFFIPHDLEISNQELAYTIKKAEQWRGEEGERRKVAVYDYIWEEETLEETVWDESGRDKTLRKDGKREVTTHVAIHTIHLDGLRQLYRHFLRLPDGAIIEVFGDMAVAGMNKELNAALARGANKLEKLHPEQVRS